MPDLWRCAGKAVLPGKRSVVISIAYGEKGSCQRRDSQSKEESAPILAGRFP